MSAVYSFVDVEYPEKVEVQAEVRSEARILRRRWPRLFLLGRPFTVSGEIRNVGSTPMPREARKWHSSIQVAWADGRESSFRFGQAQQLEPGGRLTFGPFQGVVIAPGFFTVILDYPYETYEGDPAKGSFSSMSGSKAVRLHQAVATDMVAIRTRWLLWIAAATLIVSIVGVLLALRGG